MDKITVKDIDVRYKKIDTGDFCLTDIARYKNPEDPRFIVYSWLRNKNKADVLNVALFGMTAALWREQNPGKKGNIRDYATINELICLSNMENINAVLIQDGVPQSERLQKLNRIAISQMKVLNETGGRKLLE